MLNIICAGSLAILAAVCQAESAHYLENLATLPAKGIVNESLLAKGRQHKSDYRIEADRASQRHHRNTEYDRYDRYEVEDDRGRIHRDAEQRRREENLESEYPEHRSIERPRYQRNRSIYYWRK